MTDLQKEFETISGKAHDSLNPELQNIGKVYSQGYTEWLQNRVSSLGQRVGTLETELRWETDVVTPDLQSELLRAVTLISDLATLIQSLSVEQRHLDLTMSANRFCDEYRNLYMAKPNVDIDSDELPF